MAKDLDVPFLGELPIVQSIREAGDFGRPAALQKDTVLEQNLIDLTRNVVEQVVDRNDNLPKRRLSK